MTCHKIIEVLAKGAACGLSRYPSACRARKLAAVPKAQFEEMLGGLARCD